MHCLEHDVYFDYAATTPVDSRVAELMIDFLTGKKNQGNPSSAQHSFGLHAKKAIERARFDVASLIHAEPEEIIWTSGSTESINLALKGIAHTYKQFGRHIITTRIEHKAGLEVCRKLADEGFEITYLPVDPRGLVDEKILEAAIRPDTILVSIIHVNNETGVVQNLDRLADVMRLHPVFFHVDAAQSIGKISINVKKTKIDLISLPSHKIYGPKGIGALYIRDDSNLSLQEEINGGGQENGLRSGTLATHQIVGMGKAYQILREMETYDHEHAVFIRNLLLTELADIKNICIHTPGANAVPNILNLSIPGVRNILLLQRLKRTAVAQGSACTSSTALGGGDSHVLKAMGLADDLISSSIRLSWGRFTTADEVKIACNDLKHAIAEVSKSTACEN